MHWIAIFDTNIEIKHEKFREELIPSFPMM
jgi:hypothetical protein